MKIYGGDLLFYQFDEKLHTVMDISVPCQCPTAAFVTVTELEALAPRLGLPCQTVQQDRKSVV